jgi:hypothetical protein
MGLVAFDDVRPPTCMNTSGKECALHSSGMRRTLQALSAAALQRRSRNCSKLFVLVDVSEAWNCEFGSRHSGLSTCLLPVFAGADLI